MRGELVGHFAMGQKIQHSRLSTCFVFPPAGCRSRKPGCSYDADHGLKNARPREGKGLVKAPSGFPDGPLHGGVAESILLAQGVFSGVEVQPEGTLHKYSIRYYQRS